MHPAALDPHPFRESTSSAEEGIIVRMTRWTAALVLGAVCIGILSKPAEGQLRWPDPPKRAPIRVRLVAVALSLPRSSVFSSDEVFVAETEISHEEWSLIKLVFNFLPYQPGLTDTTFDYSVVHELSAWRNPDCDETVAQLTARSVPKRQQPLVYSKNVPREDLDRRNIPLPCYEANADEYIRSSLQPIAPPPEPRTPSLKERSNLEPIPFFEVQTKPEPIPFFGDRSAPEPIPFLEEPAKPAPTPSLARRSMPKRFDDRSKLKPTPSPEEPPKPKPIPFLDEPVNHD
jgi:hypothetical protein